MSCATPCARVLNVSDQILKTSCKSKDEDLSSEQQITEKV